MTPKDKSTMNRLLGKIDGVAFTLEDKLAEPLLYAVEIIDCILDRVDGKDGEGDV